MTRIVLSRRPGESIMIGNVRIELIDYHTGSWARIGVDAPRDVKVFRAELIERDPKVRRRKPRHETD